MVCLTRVHTLPDAMTSLSFYPLCRIALLHGCIRCKRKQLTVAGKRTPHKEGSLANPTRSTSSKPESDTSVRFASGFPGTVVGVVYCALEFWFLSFRSGTFCLGKAAGECWSCRYNKMSQLYAGGMEGVKFVLYYCLQP